MNPRLIGVDLPTDERAGVFVSHVAEADLRAR